MSLATNGDDDDLGHGYLRRPISVAELLEREGYRPAVRSSIARRALSGVAASAVLALGAVVGSLMLNHGDTTSGDTLAAAGYGTGGDVVLSESGQSAVGPLSAQAGNAVPALVPVAPVVPTPPRGGFLVPAGSHPPALTRSNTARPVITSAPTQALSVNKPINQVLPSVAPAPTIVPVSTGAPAPTGAPIQPPDTSAPLVVPPPVTVTSPLVTTTVTVPPTTAPPATTVPPVPTATLPPVPTATLPAAAAPDAPAPAAATLPTADQTAPDSGVLGSLSTVTKPVFDWFS